MAWDFERWSVTREFIIQPSFIGEKLIGEKLPDAPRKCPRGYSPVAHFAPIKEIPEVGELDELETFVGSKKTKFGYGQQ